MPPRTEPSRAFATRDDHRTKLTVHFFALVTLLGAAFAANRFFTPSVFWAQWVALAAGTVFAIHLAIFARSTLATMGARRQR